MPNKSPEPTPRLGGSSIAFPASESRWRFARRGSSLTFGKVAGDLCRSVARASVSDSRQRKMLDAFECEFACEVAAANWARRGMILSRRLARFRSLQPRKRKRPVMCHGKISIFFRILTPPDESRAEQVARANAHRRPFSFTKTALATRSSLWVSAAHL
jgi:hypothetical protein